MKEIWIFNHHALTPDMGGGTRHYDFARELVKYGYKVVIFASSFHYSQYKELRVYRDSSYLEEEISGVEFIWIKTRPYKGNGLGRVLNMLEYMRKVQTIALGLNRRPDSIIGSSVHLFAVYAAYKVAKKMKCPFVMEVRDIWPQTLIDMGISKWHPFILLLGYLEVFLYKKSRKIITLLPNAHLHIEKFGIKEENIIWISNGVDISRFEGIEKSTKAKQFMITYAGSIGKVNALDTLMEAAKNMKDLYPNILFQLIGDGALKDALINYKNKHGLNNVKFLEPMNKNDLVQVLKDSDILYLGLKDSPLYRFGMSMNKFFDYLAAEVPIIFASNIKNNPLSKCGGGFCIEAENSTVLEEYIVKLYKMDVEETKKLVKDNLSYVENNYSMKMLTIKLKKLLDELE